MPEPMTLVTCSRTECMFHHPKEGDTMYIWCSHADKPHYMHRYPCPLFRLDVRKQVRAEGVNQKDFLKIIRKR